MTQQFTPEQLREFVKEMESKQWSGAWHEPSLLWIDTSPRNDRHTRHQEIIGPTDDVKRFVTHILATDTCTRYYEHMLWRIYRVFQSEDGNILSVHMSKSLYAGD